MNVEKIIDSVGIVPVIKLNNPQRDAAKLAQTLCEGGIPIAEVTFRAKDADVAIKKMKETCPEMLIGAGTVLTTNQIDLAIDAGAQFIVTPGLDIELIEYAKKRNIAIFPGCTTPSDYHTAYKYNLNILKFFPAEQSGGLAKIKAMSAPFSMFRIMPTGGINLDNLETYLRCPVVTACGGSYMVTTELIDNQNWDKIKELCEKTVAIVKKIKLGQERD